MASSALEVKVIGNIGTILLNRPDRRNALTRSMLHDLAESLDDLYGEKRVRAIVLTGRGDAFCSGLDAREIQTTYESPGAEHQWGRDAAHYRDVILRLLEVPKPIIAAVNGPAVAGGAGLVLASDIVIASRQATFGFPDTRRGSVAGVVAPLVAFRIGGGHAARLLLSGESIDADEACRIGVFHELNEHAQLWARAVQLGEQCAAGAPEAVQLTKRFLYETIGENLQTQMSAGAAASATSRTTESAQEGIAAFLEKRPPEWK